MCINNRSRCKTSSCLVVACSFSSGVCFFFSCRTRQWKSHVTNSLEGRQPLAQWCPTRITGTTPFDHNSNWIPHTALPPYPSASSFHTWPSATLTCPSRACTPTSSAIKLVPTYTCTNMHETGDVFRSPVCRTVDKEQRAVPIFTPTVLLHFLSFGLVLLALSFLYST